MGKKAQGVVFLLLSVGGFGNLVSQLNHRATVSTIDGFSIILPILFFVIGVTLLILGIRENSNKPYE